MSNHDNLNGDWAADLSAVWSDSPQRSGEDGESTGLQWPVLPSQELQGVYKKPSPLFSFRQFELERRRRVFWFTGNVIPVSDIGLFHYHLNTYYFP